MKTQNALTLWGLIYHAGVRTFLGDFVKAFVSFVCRAAFSILCRKTEKRGTLSASPAVPLSSDNLKIHKDGGRSRRRGTRQGLRRRLMKRLLDTCALSWQVFVALAPSFLWPGPTSLVLISPRLPSTSTSPHSRRALFARPLSQPVPLVGIAQIAGMYVGLLLFSFLLEFTQTYSCSGPARRSCSTCAARFSATCSDMHMLSSTISGGPPGHPRHQRRRRAERNVHRGRGLDLRRHFCTRRDHRHHAADGLAPGPDHFCRAAADLPSRPWSSARSARLLSPHSRRYRTHQRLSAGTRQRHGGAAVVQSREARLRPVRNVNAPHMDAFKDAIIAHAVYYPVSNSCPPIAIALVVWFGGNR